MWTAALGMLTGGGGGGGGGLSSSNSSESSTGAVSVGGLTVGNTSNANQMMLFGVVGVLALVMLKQSKK